MESFGAAETMDKGLVVGALLPALLATIFNEFVQIGFLVKRLGLLEFASLAET